jgi:hypothetical protein
VITKKRRGPAPTGKGTLVGVRLQPDRLAAVDAWIAKRNASMTRPEAIRAILDGVLVIVAAEKPSKAVRSSRARELAAEAIDKMIDPTTSADERAQRRRRLTKGPPEFREHRVDLPKARK